MAARNASRRIAFCKGALGKPGAEAVVRLVCWAPVAGSSSGGTLIATSGTWLLGLHHGIGRKRAASLRLETRLSAVTEHGAHKFAWALS